MAHRAVAAALALAGIFAFAFSLLGSLILFGASLAVVMNHRGAFGTGMFRGVLAFISALWLGLAGVVASLLGMVSTNPGGNFLLPPGLLLTGIAISLLGWSALAIRRARRAGFQLDA